jgi:hypothetical protein
MEKKFASLQLKHEARAEVDRAKKVMEAEMGVFLTYSQFIILACKKIQKVV